jgi:hypothetical protein
LHVELTPNSDRSFTAKRNGTALGNSAANTFIYGQWYSFQMEVVISDTVGRVTVYLDGAQVLDLTGQDTANGATLTVNNLKFFAATSSNYEVDDLIVTDTATRLTNPVRIETLYPDSDGATLDWTQSTGGTHFGVVDEAVASATDYLEAASVGNVDELGLTALSSTPTSIEEVNVIMYASKTDAAIRSVYPGVKSGATTSDGTAYFLTSSGGRVERPITTDPDTAAAWSAAGVNALQVRPKVAS